MLVEVKVRVKVCFTDHPEALNLLHTVLRLAVIQEARAFELVAEPIDVLSGHEEVLNELVVGRVKNILWCNIRTDLT